MTKKKKIIFDILLTVLLTAAALVVNLLIQLVIGEHTLVPMIFVLAVFIISLKTDGYIFGIISSLASVLLVNYAFTKPIGGFDLFSPIPLSSALIMLTVAIVTCTVTKSIKDMEKLKSYTEMEQMRANLLRAVSHDLRTPLTTIYGSCSAVIENYDTIGKEQLIKHLSEIRQDSLWLIRMVENLLSVTRIGGGDVSLKKTEVVLEELIDSVLTKTAKRYPDTKINVEIPDEFISIKMDAMLIEQVLTNLLENAFIHAKGMTSLTLRVTLSEGTAVFEVIDDGCGIPPEKLEKLFCGYIGESKNISDASRSNMGIGLSVCAAIIKAHDSVITAENLKSGGACFRFSLAAEEITDEQ